MTTTLLVSKAETFAEYSDSASDAYGAGICGSYSYAITLADSSPVPADLLTISGRTLTLSTTNTAYEY